MKKRPLLAAAMILLLVVGLIALLLRSAEIWHESDESQTDSSRTKLDFVDVSRQVGVDRDYTNEGDETYGPLWGDFNGDGWIDLVFMNHGSMPSLFINRLGGSFVDEFDRSGIRSTGWLYPQQADRHGGACADYDNDGDVDLFIAHGAKRGETVGVKYDELLKNNGDATFQDASVDVGKLNVNGRARLPTWIDFDNDGWLDLYIGNQQSRNALYKNQGGIFTDVSSEAGLDSHNAQSHVWLDYDNDARMDVLLHWPIQTYIKNLALYRNGSDGTFTDVTSESGPDWLPVPAPRGIARGDYDNDGDTDLFVASAYPNENRLYRNDGGIFSVLEGSFGPNERDENILGVS